MEREQQIPMHHWRWPKEAFSFLLPHGKERGDGKKFPGAVREGEIEAERDSGGTMRKSWEKDHGPDYRKKREVGPREPVQVRLARTA